MPGDVHRPIPRPLKRARIQWGHTVTLLLGIGPLAGDEGMKDSQSDVAFEAARIALAVLTQEYVGGGARMDSATGAFLVPGTDAPVSTDLATRLLAELAKPAVCSAVRRESDLVEILCSSDLDEDLRWLSDQTRRDVRRSVGLHGSIRGAVTGQISMRPVLVQVGDEALSVSVAGIEAYFADYLFEFVGASGRPPTDAERLGGAAYVVTLSRVSDLGTTRSLR